MLASSAQDTGGPKSGGNTPRIGGVDITASKGDKLQPLVALDGYDQYDIVLVDTPPMLEIPDARIIGRVADTTILVVRAGATTRNSVSAASQRLSDDGIDLMGAIVNDWNPANSSAGYYWYTRYYTSSPDEQLISNETRGAG